PIIVTAVAMAASFGIVGAGAKPQQAPASPRAPQQPSELTIPLTSEPGAQPRLGVPDFIALSNDAETDRIAKTIAQVLYDDLAFEREFGLIPRDTYRTIPAAKSFEDVPLDRWREL